MLFNTSNQPTKFRTKNWVEINDASWGKYNEVNQIKWPNVNNTDKGVILKMVLHLLIVKAE